MEEKIKEMSELPLIQVDNTVLDPRTGVITIKKTILVKAKTSKEAYETYKKVAGGKNGI